MDLEFISECVEKIRDCSGDAEMAHGMEDNLYRAFIKHVSGLSPMEEAGRIPEMAKLVLSTSKIEFERWCA